jgi:hypothetical protein
MTNRDQLAQRIADGVARTERNFQRAIGADWIDSYTRSWAVADETYLLVMAPDRPVQFLGLRHITNRGAHHERAN